jgi:hypothetical protein
VGAPYVELGVALGLLLESGGAGSIAEDTRGEHGDGCCCCCLGVGGVRLSGDRWRFRWWEEKAGKVSNVRPLKGTKIRENPGVLCGVCGCAKTRNNRLAY